MAIVALLSILEEYAKKENDISVESIRRKGRQMIPGILGIKAIGKAA
jgi:hypothetical protein